MANWPTESHRMKEDLELHWWSSDTSWSCNAFVIQSLQKSKSLVFLYADASGKLQRIRAEFWRKLDQKLDHRGLDDVESNVASEVSRVEIKSEEV